MPVAAVSPRGMLVEEKGEGERSGEHVFRVARVIAEARGSGAAGSGGAGRHTHTPLPTPPPPLLSPHPIISTGSLTATVGVSRQSMMASLIFLSASVMIAKRVSSLAVPAVVLQAMRGSMGAFSLSTPS